MGKERAILLAALGGLSAIGALELRNKLLVGSVQRPWIIEATVVDSEQEYWQEMEASKAKKRK